MVATYWDVGYSVTALSLSCVYAKSSGTEFGAINPVYLRVLVDAERLAQPV